MTDSPATPETLHPIFSSLFENLQSGLLVAKTSRDGQGKADSFRVKLANPQFCKIFGLDRQTLDDAEINGEITREMQWGNAMHTVADSGKAQCLQESFPSGERFLKIHLLPLEDDHVGIIFNDITPLIIHQEEALQEKAKADAILASIGDPFCILNRDYIVTYENEAARELWGDNTGRKCFAAYHSRDTLCPDCHAVRVFEDGKTHKSEKVVSTRDRGERYLEVLAAPMKNKEGEVTKVLHISRDITSRKMAEKGKERLIQELQSALAKVKRLTGLLPICSECKKVRDGKGYWNQIESYIRSHSEVEFSQCICEECAEARRKENPKKK